MNKDGAQEGKNNYGPDLSHFYVVRLVTSGKNFNLI